jgi:DNA repair exonuclease SbcCD nuclease subunit
LKVIKEPTLLKFVREKKTLCSVAAIPYLGDCNDENKELVRFSGKASIALMHTDISKMKFDNGMTIVGAVDAEKFAGRVIAGHIHKRQETEKVVYVGNPYHLKRSDIGNQKGIYTMNMETGVLDFIPNNYSPIFQKIDIEMFMNMSDQDKMRALHNNYTDVLVNEEDEHKYKMADIRALLSQSNAKRAEIKSVRQKNESTEEDDEVHEEHTVDELIEQSIDSLEGYEDEYKAELKVLSHEYITAAQSILASESNV